MTARPSVKILLQQLTLIDANSTYPNSLPPITQPPVMPKFSTVLITKKLFPRRTLNPTFIIPTTKKFAAFTKTLDVGCVTRLTLRKACTWNILSTTFKRNSLSASLCRLKVRMTTRTTLRKVCTFSSFTLC